jgi:hypothetical protein
MGKTGSVNWVKIKNKKGFRFVKPGKSKYKKVIPKLRFKLNCVNRRSLRSMKSINIK